MDSPEVGTSDSFPWKFHASSVLGASHRRAGTVNQDYCAASRLSGGQLLLAVSDGHGSQNCPYSDRGSRWAVECVRETVEALLDVLPVEPDESKRLKVLSESLRRTIPRAWREKIKTDENFQLGEPPRAEGSEARLPPVDSAFLPYGATLLFALLDETYALFFQLGDGDIRIIDDTGCVSAPIRPDSTLIANETTSLCNRASSDLFRCATYLFSKKPALRFVWLSTDGYANSYDQEAGFTQAIGDTNKWLRERWKSDPQSQMDSALNAISEHGSGDDISVALAWCGAVGAIPDVSPAILAQAASSGETEITPDSTTTL